MLHIHRADRAEVLVDRLAGVLTDPAGQDPFQPELVSVPSRGIERWLAQELSHRLGSTGPHNGVCANVLFPFPAAVIGWVIDAAHGREIDVYERRTAPDPWSPPRLVWTLLDVLDEVDDLGAFGAHIAGDSGRARRLPALRHAADLFDRYAVHRPDMVRAWASNLDIDAPTDVDGVGQPLPSTATWQPRLWRAARRRLGPSFAERVTTAAERLEDAGPIPALPTRLAVYGLTSLPATYVEILDALAEAHDVHLFLLHPSPALWSRTAPVLDGATARPRRAEDPTAEVPRHPLVSSWGRDAREMQVVLAGRGSAPGDPHEAITRVMANGTLLARLQQDVRGDVVPPGPPIEGEQDRRVPLEATAPPQADAPRRAADDSLQVHACHGRLRQVEVLRDVVLGLMSDDPTLQPRDIVVMCPDVETFAPLVDAVFGADVRLEEVGFGDTEAPLAGRLPDVRVRLADRSLRQVNPLLRTVADLLRLPDGRVEASTILELAHRDPVRTRFGFSSDDLETLEEWVDELAIRWGLDGDHRARHGLETDANTWRAGLDRLLLGVAVTEDGPRTVAGLVPHDDVEGGAVDLAGRFVELVARVESVVEGLRDPRPVATWCDAVRTAASLLTHVRDDAGWQRIQLDRLLDDLRDQAGGDAAPDVPVTLAELRTLLDDALRGRPSRANHRTGDLTVCTLVPMRSVPYRVVCLLGLDDETFPRRSVPSGDDLIGRVPVVGDRDPRTEDRQLLLDALLAARDHLVITYRARDERTNAEVPPAVPVAELLDVLDATARPADGHGCARDLLIRRHPLRAADLRTFDPDDPFGFDPVAVEATRARLGPQREPASFLDVLPAPAPAPTTVEWADFVRFLDKPVKGYLRHRLGISLREADDPLDDLLPVEMSGLPEWQVGTRLLAGAVEGRLDRWLAAERSRGTLPAGQIGVAKVDEIVASVQVIAAKANEQCGELLAQPAEPVEVDLRVGDLHLVGAIENVKPDLLAVLDYGRPKPKRLLKLWLPWVALHAMGRGRTGLMVTRGKKPSSRNVKHPEVARLCHLDEPLSRSDALARLEVMAELFRAGHERPLPLFSDTSGLFVGELSRGRSRAQALGKADRDAWLCGSSWSGNQWGDSLEPETLQVFGRISFDELLAIEPEPHETGPGWHDDEPTRFGRLALRMWQPIIADSRSEGIK